MSRRPFCVRVARRGLLLVLVVLVVGLIATESRAQTLDNLIPRLMQLGDIPGLSAAVVQGDSLAWSGSFGIRDAITGTDVTDQTVFEAASLSKTVFAYVTLRLVDRGVIDLDTPLLRYAPYSRLAGDPRSRRVTARMCLSHTTGLPNWGTRFLAEPGTRFTYSGEGIRFLRKTLEVVTGLSLEDLARREAFEPLGMTDSSYLWPAGTARPRARGHDAMGHPQPRRKCPDGSAAASLLTTARDYARFLQACLRGDGLSPAMHAEMLQVQTPANLGGSPAASSHLGWGLGWGTMDGRDGEVIWQWGDNGDTVALVAGCPATGRGLVYLANSATGLSIAYDLLAAVLPGPAWCLDALGYERYNSPARVRRMESLAQQAIQQRDWARAGRDLNTLLELQPDHPWAAARLHEIEVQRAALTDGKRDHG
ncbi:MAG: serine hydrolase domain-containing protein [Candidatus Krumholzibacteriia bacterium]